MSFRTYLAAAAVALAPVVAPAATVTVDFTAFGSLAAGNVDKAGAIAARDSFIGAAPIVLTETFDGFTACDDTNPGSCDFSPLTTAVGTFNGITPAGGGSSQVAPDDQLVVRTDDPNAFGRYDVDGSEGKWLDSNDMNGILWEIPGGANMPSSITKLAFFLTDVDDVGSVNFSIQANGGAINTNVVHNKPSSGRPNGELMLVTMLFSEALSDLNIQMISGTNDGYGIDGIKVAAVPLPAAGLLMLGALGGLGAVRARRRKTAA